MIGMLVKTDRDVFGRGIMVVKLLFLLFYFYSYYYIFPLETKTHISDFDTPPVQFATTNK